MIKVSPSILAADPLRMGEEAQKMVDAGCDWLHVDIMDGNFVPNLSYGPSMVKALRSRFTLPLDVHLMILHPEQYAETFIRAGASGLTVHAEATENLPALLKQIRTQGASPAVALKPATPAEAVADVLDLCDMILVMTVEPGFGGQKFIPESLEKVKQIKAKLIEKGLDNVDIEIDGGINIENLVSVLEAGANVIVAGSAVFKNDAGANVKRFKEIMSTY